MEGGATQYRFHIYGSNEEEVEFWDAHGEGGAWLELHLWQMYMQTADMSVFHVQNTAVFTCISCNASVPV